jgi:hypothetical protein
MKFTEFLKEEITNIKLTDVKKLHFDGKDWKAADDFEDRRAAQLFYDWESRGKKLHLIITLKKNKNSGTAQIQDDQGEELSLVDVNFTNRKIWDLVSFKPDGSWKK